MNRLILQFTAFLHLQGYAPNSIQNHRLDLLRFREWLETREQASLPGVQALTREDLLGYQAHLSRRLKPRSINRHLSSLKLFFRFLEESAALGANPMDHYPFPRTIPDLPGMLLPGEVSALLDAPDESHYLGLRDRAMLELLYSSGLKLQELIALDVADLQMDAGLVRVRGRRERMVPLVERAAALLQRYLEESRPGRVLHAEETCLFPGRNGTRISRVGVWKMIKKYARRAGIEKNFNPRTLRHAFAIHLILGGMDLDAIKVLFGYRHLDATALYAHVNAPEFSEAYRRFHPLAAGAPEPAT